MAFITDKDIAEASQAICKLAQRLVRHNHDRPLLAMLEICDLNTGRRSATLLASAKSLTRDSQPRLE